MAAEGESGTWLVFQTRWCLFVFTFWLVKTPVFVILHLAVSPFLCRYGFILLHWLSSLVSAFLLEMVVYLAFLLSYTPSGYIPPNIWPSHLSSALLFFNLTIS